MLSRDTGPRGGADGSVRDPGGREMDPEVRFLGCRKRNAVAITLLVGLVALGGCTTRQGDSSKEIIEAITADELQQDMSTAGTINRDSNPVHWTKLKGVPDGLADGEDADAFAELDCGSGESPRKGLLGWGCAELGGGASYEAGQGLILDGSTFRVNTALVQSRVTGSCDAGSSVRAIDADGNVECETDDAGTGGGEGWLLTGNGGTTPGPDFIGTTDNVPLEFKVNGARVLRIEPEDTPNIIGGYRNNSAAIGVKGATISGGGSQGQENRVHDIYGTVGGGEQNNAGNPSPFIGAYWATVAGGLKNTASQNSATVAGGYNNTALNTYSTVAGGQDNAAAGQFSAVPGGHDNNASGSYSFAAGRHSRADDSGAFVWADSGTATVASPGANTFTVRASGGVWFGTTSTPAIASGRFINTSTGGYLSTGGAWTDSSDRDAKTGFRAVDARAVLDGVIRLPLSTWSYKAEPGTRHLGPVAQDFHAIFGVGADDKHIAPLDSAGVALAAIQGLYDLVQEKDARIDAQEERITELEERLAKLEAALGLG